jgi:hypothetical protein
MNTCMWMNPGGFADWWLKCMSNVEGDMCAIVVAVGIWGSIYEN